MPYLDEDRLYNNIEEKYKVASGEARKAYSDVLDTICEMPRTNIAEVVMCKDCKHAEIIGDVGCNCKNRKTPWFNDEFEVYMGLDDFCSYGKPQKEV